MNEKETAEIRRRFRPDKHNITCLRGCYVNEKKEIISSFEQSLLMMPEEEAEKYLAIFRRTLSGSLGKNLLPVDFSTKQVESGEEYKVLADLRKSGLQDADAVKKFFDAAVASLTFEGNYLILLLTDAYDVPMHAMDGVALEDSDTMFTYILCSVCPVKLTKPALRYVAAAGEFHNLNAEWTVGAPKLGFMFPAFDSRRSNIYGSLFYTRNTAVSYKEFTDAIFRTEMPMPADEQKETFGAVLTDSLADECSYDVLQSVHGQLAQKIGEHKASKNPEPLFVTKNDVSAVLSACGVSENKLQSFNEKFDEAFGQNADVPPANLIETRRFELKTPDVVVTVNPERPDLVETRIIDGTAYILIRADSDVELNGINVKVTERNDGNVL